ncbi:MAG TPA: NAD(+) synthase [Spongiibacteraceae bacterium]|nr:NAD(+) synthase [Spongiibacteraceae bacterium]
MIREKSEQSVPERSDAIELFVCQRPGSALTNSSLESFQQHQIADAIDHMSSARNIDEIVNDILSFDEEASIAQIVNRTRELLRDKLRRRGLVLGVSGGVDSAVCAALAVKAVGPERVFALLMPESDSSAESVINGRLLAEHLGIRYVVEDIAPTLEAIGCYRWRDEAIRVVFPQYESGWKNKIVIAGGGEGKINHFNLVVADPDGCMHEQRLGLKEYLQIVAATNFKQRIRKTLEFFHADRLNYAVVGTPNRVEYDQGFFVKGGDGSADVKPIAHLYKSQVYRLARHLGLPDVICNAIPTTDTYSLAQGQDEFYYALPYKEMDIALWYYNNDRAADELGRVLGISGEQAQFIYRDIENKRTTTAPLHWPALLVEPVKGPLSAP